MSDEDLYQIWLDIWDQLGLAMPVTDVYLDLLHRYQEPQRYYHTLQHIKECFAHQDYVQKAAHFPAEVAMAIWYHDAIYDVRAQDNEARSAELATEVLRDAGANKAQIERIRQHIMATKTHQSNQANENKDSDILLDIDLLILAAEPSRFEEYQQQIRQEYKHVPALIYRLKRSSILREFLSRDAIYKNHYFADQFEEDARRNLMNAK